MNARAPLYVASLLCFLAVACAPPAEQAESSGAETVSTEADVEAIRGVMDRWTTGLNAEDTDAMLALLTDGTNHMGPNEPAISGHAAVGGWFDAMFAGEGAPVFAIETDEVRVAGDWAVGRGVYSFTVPAEDGESATVPGKWMIIFERGTDGAWRAASTIWNLDVPEPASA
jgi:uncharacterized protein (TIGR02246 family)